MNEDTFDVVVPLGKAHEMTEKSIRSALAQPFVNCVFVVVNGRYPIDRVEALRDIFADEVRSGVLKLIVDYSLKNANQARNLGVSYSRADWVAFLDSDDEWCDGWLERVCAEIREDRSVEFFYCSLRGQSKRGVEKFKRAVDWKNFRTPEHYVTSGHCAQSSGFVVKRRLLDSCRWRHDVSRRQDWLFFIDAVRAGMHAKPIADPYVVKGRDPEGRNFERADILTFLRALVGNVPFSIFLRHAVKLMKMCRLNPLMLLQIASLLISVRHIDWFLGSNPHTDASKDGSL